MKLWDKGYETHQAIEKFTVGNDRNTDLHIAKYDIQASLAHARMLAKVKLIQPNELTQLEEGLHQLLAQVTSNTFVIEEKFEDVHSKIEYELIQKYGAIGKKIHTARSRNDQVLVALHLYYKEEILQLKSLIHNYFTTLIELATAHQEKTLPGYTHLQVAMPSSFGLWFSSYAELLIDDISLLNAALRVVDQNPLGSAAGYGSSFPIDRTYTTKLLGFSTLKYNVVAAQLSRGKSERTLSMALASVANTLARFAMDICLYMSQNFDFISFPQEYTTGSSIMPHKKNPDIFELIRGKCNQIQALPTEMLLLTNNLPSGYHRDYQLLKEPMIQAMENLKDCLTIFNTVIPEIIVKTVDIQDEKYQYLHTVDSINTLVTQGMSFRDAYQKIGKEVQQGNYVPNEYIQHTHEGSIHHLCLEEITEKMKNVMH